MDFTRYQYEYHHRGWTLLPDFAPAWLVEKWVGRSNELFAEHVFRVDAAGDGQFRAGDFGGDYHYSVIDGKTLKTEMPSLFGWYEGARFALAAIVCRPVIVSPYPLSAINIKRYGPGDEQGWHFDTNAVTALLYLTDDGCPTRVINFLEEEEDVIPMPGSLLLMQGRRVKHCVPKIPEAVARLTMPLNYYHPDDVNRPERIDEIVYGSKEDSSEQRA
jgi:hypothetical protein